jgi:hypothetical protein
LHAQPHGQRPGKHADRSFEEIPSLRFHGESLKLGLRSYNIRCTIFKTKHVRQ